MVLEGNREAGFRSLEELDAWYAGQHLPQWDDYVGPLPSVLEIWNGFWDLDGDRAVVVIAGPMGGGVTMHRRIPYISRSKWLDDQGFVGHERHRAKRLIDAMDATFVRVRNAEGADPDDEDDSDAAMDDCDELDGDLD